MGKTREIDRAWPILATGFLILFFSGGTRFTLGLTLKPMADDLGWSRSAIALTFATFMLVSALAMPFVGRLSDRYSLKTVLVTAVTLSAVGIGLMSVVVAPWHAVLLYGVVFGLGAAGASIPPVGVMVSRWFPRRIGTANSAAISGIALGQLVIIAVLATHLADLGWRNAFALLGIVNLIVVVPIVLAVVRTRPSDERAQTERDLEVANQKALSLENARPLYAIAKWSTRSREGSARMSARPSSIPGEATTRRSH